MTFYVDGTWTLLNIKAKLLRPMAFSKWIWSQLDHVRCLSGKCYKDYHVNMSLKTSQFGEIQTLGKLLGNHMDVRSIEKGHL